MGSQNWGADHSTHALKKDCNWVSYVTFIAEVDPVQEKEMTRLRHRNSVDELLMTQSRFIRITDSEVTVMSQSAKRCDVQSVPPCDYA